MTHLLDSDVLIDAVGGRTNALLALERIGPRSLSISAISVGEFLDGVMLAPDALRRRQEFAEFLEPMRILDVGEQIIVRFASICSELRRRGQLIADFDMVIAATAIGHDLVLVTRNRKHFERIPELGFVTPDDLLKG